MLINWLYEENTLIQVDSDTIKRFHPVDMT